MILLRWLHSQSDLQNQCNHYQNSDSPFAKMERQILKFRWNFKGFQTAETISENKIEGFMLLKFKTY
jgi:hypothetical protein